MDVRPLGETNRHYWQVQRMAKTTGVDLARAFDAGDLGTEDWAAIVTRCRGCRWEGCANWLHAQDTDKAAIPQACPNGGQLERLREAVEQSL